MDANTKKMIETLKLGKEIEYGFLGVMVNPDEKGTGSGVMIQDASPGLPAARAGLLARDVVVSINGNPVREQDDLFLNISAAQAGTEVDIEVERAGRKQTFKARLGKSAPISAPIVSNRPKPVHGMRVDYASTLGVGSVPPEGVLITDREPGSPADRKLKEGFPQGGYLVVTAVDGQPVPTPADFRRLAEGKASVTLDVVEVGGTSARRTVTLP
jgi:S1-C subfamily serine protease